MQYTYLVNHTRIRPQLTRTINWFQCSCLMRLWNHKCLKTTTANSANTEEINCYQFLNLLYTNIAFKSNIMPPLKIYIYLKIIHTSINLSTWSINFEPNIAVYNFQMHSALHVSLVANWSLHARPGDGGLFLHSIVTLMHIYANYSTSRSAVANSSVHSHSRYIWGTKL